MEIISLMLLSYPLTAFIVITTMRKVVKILADNGYKISDVKENDDVGETSFELSLLYIPGVNLGYASVLCIDMLSNTDYLIDYLTITGTITKFNDIEELVYNMNPTTSTAMKLNMDDNYVNRMFAEIALETLKPKNDLNFNYIHNGEEVNINYDIDSNDNIFIKKGDVNLSVRKQKEIINNIRNKRFITYNKDGSNAYITFLEENENIIITDIDGYLLSLNNNELMEEIISIIKEKLLIISPRFKEEEVKVFLENSSKITLIGNIPFNDLKPNENQVDIIYYKDPRSLSRELTMPKVLKKVRKDII